MSLEKLRKLCRIVKENGGLRKSIYRIYRDDALKTGTLVGTDAYGNKYYENNEYFVGRNRWVIYSDKVNLDYDGSQIPAEWHAWMHNMTDHPPTVKPPVQYKWLSGHQENMTGTSRSYMPYDTTRPKIQPWKPGRATTS